MKILLMVLLASAGLFAQVHGAPPAAPGGAAQPNYLRYQPTYDDVKSMLGLTDDQLSQLRQMQQDKMAATQAFYSKMGDKQKELNALLESGSTDATHVGQVMIELQNLRKQPPPSANDTHDRAIAVLTADQKQKLMKLEDAAKLRAAVDQATQLALLNPPVAAPVPNPGAPQLMKK